MFKNLLARAVLLSSGSIPVARNPNSTPTAGEQPSKPQTEVAPAHAALFRETFGALEREEAIGVFPEGTSYTEPRIMQVKDGAAWAALEYTKWAKEHGVKNYEDMKICPAAIVYTNKSKYRSQVCCFAVLDALAGV